MRDLRATPFMLTSCKTSQNFIVPLFKSEKINKTGSSSFLLWSFNRWSWSTFISKSWKCSVQRRKKKVSTLFIRPVVISKLVPFSFIPCPQSILVLASRINPCLPTLLIGGYDDAGIWRCSFYFSIHENHVTVFGQFVASRKRNSNYLWHLNKPKNHWK